MLGRDMVILTRLAKAQGSPAAAPAPTIVVRWERRGDRILLRAPSHENTADEGSAVALAVANWNFAPVLHALPISVRGERTSVVDVTEMYLGDHPTFSLPGNRLAQFGVRQRDRDRTWLEWAKSFPINVEVRVVHTYAADRPPWAARGRTTSATGRKAGCTRPSSPTTSARRWLLSTSTCCRRRAGRSTWTCCAASSTQVPWSGRIAYASRFRSGDVAFLGGFYRTTPCGKSYEVLTQKNTPARIVS